MEILPVIAAIELESVWLLIGFFVFVAVCAAVAILILLRQHNYGLPPNSTQAVMLAMLLITLIVSLLIAAGLYRLSDTLFDDSPANSGQYQHFHEVPLQQANTSLSPEFPE